MLDEKLLKADQGIPQKRDWIPTCFLDQPAMPCFPPTMFILKAQALKLIFYAREMCFFEKSVNDTRVVDDKW